MSFLKGMVIGAGITAAAYMMYNEGIINKKRMIKQAKKLANKIEMN